MERATNFSRSQLGVTSHAKEPMSLGSVVAKMSKLPMYAGTACSSALGRSVPSTFTFAGRLRELREAAGITRYELAKRAQLPKQTVYKLEQGDRDPSWTTAVALANALGVNVSVFVVKSPEPPIVPTASPPPSPPPAAKPRARRKPAG